MISSLILTNIHSQASYRKVAVVSFFFKQKYVIAKLISICTSKTYKYSIAIFLWKDMKKSSDRKFPEARDLNSPFSSTL